MRIGIIVSFFDFRNDVRELISLLRDQSHNIVIFYTKKEKEKVLNNSIDGVTYREIIERIPSFKNRIWEYLFLFFKRIPKSRRNYFLMESFKINNSSLKRKQWMYLPIMIQKLGFNFITYDKYLSHLSYSGITALEDVDKFIGFTEFPCDFFAARLIKEKHPMEVYVYSWDHPCKHTRFSKKFSYMVWSNAIRDDMVEIQRIPEQNIRVVGSTQFAYLHDFRTCNVSFVSPYSVPYVYYCCAIGIKKLVMQEVLVIQRLAQALNEVYPDWKMVVRPYPVLDTWSLYNQLKKINNVLFDDGFRSKDLSVKHSFIQDKLNKMEHAEMILHTGSTIGLEASLLNRPSFIVDFGYKSKKGLSLYNFIHQYQNEKYLIDKGASIKSTKEFKELLTHEISREDKTNTLIQSCFHLLPLETIANSLLSHETGNY